MSLITASNPTVGLYRHFKGGYYFIQNIAKDCTSGIMYCYYFNICNPEQGVFVRPINEWFDTETDKGTISERPDNKTGQIHRFERVEDLNFQLGSVSTEQLTEELIRRTDSPIHALDLEELNSKIDCIDYAVGQPLSDNFVFTYNTFCTEEAGKKYFTMHKVNSETHLYKRTFIRIK